MPRRISRLSSFGLVVAVLCCALWPSPVRAADFRAMEPVMVCSLLTDLSLRGSHWQRADTLTYSCSASKLLDEGNRIIYRPTGGRDTVTHLKLHLYMTHAEASRRARAEFIECARALSRRAAGRELPETVVEALASAGTARAETGDVVYRVEREERDLSGFELKLHIE